MRIVLPFDSDYVLSVILPEMTLPAARGGAYVHISGTEG
jgi:hypothetical protein